MDAIEKRVMAALNRGPRTIEWLKDELPVEISLFTILRLINKGFVEERGSEYLYPQTDRRDGVRRKRGKRLKTWTVVRRYYALSDAGRVLMPLDSLRIGAV